MLGYFFDAGVDAVPPFAEGAAATVFGLTCFGFLGSRPPFAMAVPPVLAPECSTI